MYTTLYNLDETLKHSHECKIALGSKDPDCPRCIELLAGEIGRDGWQRALYERSQREMHDRTLLHKLEYDMSNYE